MNEKLLEIKHLTAGFKYDGVWTKVIHDVSYDVRRGEILGVVGESGSGKSVTVKNVLRLLPRPAVFLRVRSSTKGAICSSSKTKRFAPFAATRSP